MNQILLLGSAASALVSAGLIVIAFFVQRSIRVRVGSGGVPLPTIRPLGTPAPLGLVEGETAVAVESDAAEVSAPVA